ncbi:carboxypeptidase-like regulatory domain-containing protein [Flavobacterium sp. NPDC079362]|uniref:carboxypeptidase-like regulatory domain-containing protein n=1 Tax=Flavobacterium sp. NPDC079362 TaxID=3390566 RepID=UPI003CFC9777
MKKLLLFLFVSAIGYSQSIYRGNVSEKGMPIPGVTICVFNSKRCTTSDFDGNYAIEAKVGDQLQLSFIGMKTKVIRINNTNLLENDEYVNQIVSGDYIEKLKKGNDSLKISKSSGNFEFNLASGIEHYDIMKISRNNDGFYELKNRDQYHKLAFEVSNEFILSTPIRLPKYQKTYAQGRSLNGELAYQSPLTNEIFSWGPNVNSLQYSQNSSQCYPQGDIVNRTSAGANQLQLFDPNNFYQNTEDNKFSFLAQIESPKGNFLKINFGYKTGNIIIPATRNNEITTSLKYFRNITKYSKIEALLSYNDFENNFSNANFGINKVVFANAVTPIHFDNKWGSTLESGLQRSYTALENNPYYVIANNLDTNKSKVLSFNFNQVYSKDRNQNAVNASFQSSEIKNTNGQNFYFAEITAPNFDKRIEKFKNASVSDAFKRIFNNWAFIESKIDFRFQDRKLERNYFSGFASQEDFPDHAANQIKLNVPQERFEVLSNVNGSYTFTNVFSTYSQLVVKGSSGLNYSSTVKSRFMSNYLATVELRRFFNEELWLTISHGYNETEPSLQNNNLNFNSLQYHVNQFKQLQNNLELITRKDGIATNENMTSLDLNYRLSYFWNLTMNYYHKKVNNLYTPVFNQNSISWSPDVNYKQNGIEFAIERMSYLGRDFKYGFNLNFTYYKNEVTGLNNSQARIPFAGFADVNKNYIVGQSLGVIVGSSYLRDNNQNIIIDELGFPVKDSNSKILGDPNPDFVVGFFNSFQYKNFLLQVSFDWSQGGQLWNGTQQTLNYYGKSELTESQRNVTNYVFNGVTESGAANTKAVSFYDTNLPVEQNRWTRYGVDGVAEDAIEDATYFRLSNINLSYSKDFREDNVNKFSFKISVFVNNAFIMAKSKSAFSSNSMFNSIDTTGFDYFNTPMMRSFGSSLTIKF